MPEEGMWLLTWSGRKEETWTELLLQALEQWLGCVGGTDRHRDTEHNERVNPCPHHYTTVIYPAPPRTPTHVTRPCP